MVQLSNLCVDNDCLGWISSLLYNCLSVCPTSMNEITEAGSILETAKFTDVSSLLDAFSAAAACGDLEAYFGCFATSGRFLGTDVNENWTAAEFMAFAKPHFKSDGCVLCL